MIEQIKYKWFISLSDDLMEHSDLFLSPAGAVGRAREILQCPPSVCLSVTFSFRTVTRKRDVMGVCCIVFDIDGMLFEFFMNFLNIENFIFKISCFLRVSCYFQYIKKNWCNKKIPGGGGGVLKNIFFFRKIILSHFTFYAIFNI